MPITRQALVASAAAVLAACSTRPSLAPRPLTLAPSLADSVRSESVARGATLHTIVNLAKPWRAYVLDVDMRCHELQAVKGAGTAVGRLTTAQLLQSIPASRRPLAAVNADFFLFAPPGVPTNAHVEAGTVISGPDNRPVFWRSTDGAIGFDTLRVTGSLTAAGRTVSLTAWNRPAPRTNGVADARWGVPLDSVVRKRFWRLDPVSAARPGSGALSLRGRYRVRTPRAQDTLVFGDTLALHLAPQEKAPTDGEELTIDVHLVSRSAPDRRFRDVVGGRPMLVTDSSIAKDVDTEGAASFRDLNPRTLLGFDRQGKRVWLVVVDGRQQGYSMGMTLRQEAELMLALGATRAMNLDGGGSSALDVRTASGTTRTVNKPSDAGGERAVANALAVLQRCR
jgi:hypothetical protein